MPPTIEEFYSSLMQNSVFTNFDASLVFVSVLCSLIEDILSFSHKITEWMFNALQNLPVPLGIRKVQSTSARVFLQFTVNL